MGPDPADSSPRPVLPRSAIILLTLACAAVVAFGLAATRGIFTPVFFAFVLTLCVHPLRRWMQARGISRGIATGTTIAAVFGLLAAFGGVLVASLAQFSALLPQYAPQLAQLGASIAGMLESLGFGPEQAQAVLDGFTPGRILGFLGDLLGNVAGLVGSLVIILGICRAANRCSLPPACTFVRRPTPACGDRPRAGGEARRRGFGRTDIRTGRERPGRNP